MRRLSTLTGFAAFLAILAMGVPPVEVLADGTETLGPPSIQIETGTGIVAAGVGLIQAQPAAINISVPAGATVNQVLLYWEGQMVGNVAGDDTIEVTGQGEVTGTLIGGPTFFFNAAGGAGAIYSSAFRADITDLGLISGGANSIQVGGLNFSFANNGAGILVIFEEASGASDIQVLDGDDLAYFQSPPPIDATVAQTFTFDASSSARTATLSMFFGSVEGETSTGGDFRPNSIEVTVDGVTTVFSDLLGSNDGEEWDTQNLSIPIPAGATSLTVQAFSRDDFRPFPWLDPQAASLAWVAAGLSVPLTPSCQIQLTKEVAPDNNCDGVEDGSWTDSVLQDEELCVVYRICVENTGDDTIDTDGVQVEDAHLGIVSLDFGTLPPNNPDTPENEGLVCKVIPLEAEGQAAACTLDPESCICTEVAGPNTASITTEPGSGISSAVCQATGNDACLEEGSVCEDDALVSCEGCSISIVKKVAEDDNCDGTPNGDWMDFVSQPVGQCVIYQICVTNTGSADIDASGVEVSDAHLGSDPGSPLVIDFGPLTPAQEVCKLIPVEAASPQCTGAPDSCLCEEVEGPNTAVITAAICDIAGNPNPCADPNNPREGSVCFDDAEVACTEETACRMTGGHVAMSRIASTFEDDLGVKYTTGGQIGAPNESGCADSPWKGTCVEGLCYGGTNHGDACANHGDCPNDGGRNSDRPWGDWEHNHHSGPDDTGTMTGGSFAFHSGTAAAPDEAYIKSVHCADPGWCVQARPAPFKQIFWEGFGVFHNMKGPKGSEEPLPDFSNCPVQPVVYDKKTGGSIHYYRAHVSDFGEPAGIRQKPLAECTWVTGGYVDNCTLADGVSLVEATPDPEKTALHPLCDAQDCQECPDFYEIEIHCGATADSPVAYSVSHHITEGNFQLHPPVGDSCNPEED